MDEIRNKLRIEYQHSVKKDDYIKNDLDSCKDIVKKIDSALSAGKQDFRFGGHHIYTNFDCMEYKILKEKYKKDCDFFIVPLPKYPSVTKMHMVFDEKTDKVRINLS